MIELLGLCGSLRARSYNRAGLQAAALLAPPGARLRIYDGMATLPHFNPDADMDPLPEQIARLRAAVGEAAGLVIACPEYAHGIPGSFKNLLDWLVSSLEFPGKPVMLINCSPRASDAQAALRNVLSIMSARIVDDAALALPLLGSTYGAQEIVSDPAMAQPLAAALDKFCALV